MNEERAIRDYFGQPGFRRFLKLLERQYSASLDGVRGYVSLSDIEAAERDALDSFYGIYSPPKPGENKRYSLKKFERILLESRFGLTIPRLLGIMHGGPVETRREQEGRTAAEWSGMIGRALEDFKGHADEGIEAWARGLDVAEGHPSPGYRTLWLVFGRSRQEADRCLRFCLTALCRVRGIPENGDDLPTHGARATVLATVAPLLRLPVLSAAVTGDAHALDWKYPLGRLFWWGLTSVSGGAPTLASEEQLESVQDEDETPLGASSRAITIREGYRRGGVADDDLSSQVMLYAPELFGSFEERVLTLRQVEQLSAERLARLRHSTVYMVENPSVFAELIDAAVGDGRREGEPSGAVETELATGNIESARTILICGNGRPSVAVLRLLDQLLSHERRDAVIQYAGDLDAGGLSIAQGLQLRYPNAFRPWRMDAEQYVRYADRGIPLEAGERARLSECRPAWDCDLIGFMLENGAKLHQELWIEELVDDMGLGPM